MDLRVIVAEPDGNLTVTDAVPDTVPVGGWVWADVRVDVADARALAHMTAALGLDPLAVHDAATDADLPKLDDFGEHLLLVLHGLSADHVETYEVDCFVTGRHLVTVHNEQSPTIDALWEAVLTHSASMTADVSELVGRLGDLLTRRLLAVVDAFDSQIDPLIVRALDADPELLEEVTAIRLDLAEVRQVVYPQREALDDLRRSPSPIVSEAARRRAADAFDAASRAVSGLDAARSGLAEILDAYRGAEARKATDVTKVLTIYAAVMLPLSLIAGFFGMNFTNLPWIDREWGWWVVLAFMALITVVSLGMFVALGWIHRPSGRRAGALLGRGLVEAARTPVQVGGALFEVTTLPLRTITRRGDDPGDEPS